jgi:hypothetical protein
VADLIGPFRLALAADLAVEFPDTEIHQGERTGKATDRAKLALFWSGTTEQTTVVAAEARFLIRYWPVTALLRDDAPAGTRDPAELEAAAFQLQDFLQSKQTGYPATGAWYSRLVRVTPDYDPEEWGVEAELLVVFNNPAVVTA